MAAVGRTGAQCGCRLRIAARSDAQRQEFPSREAIAPEAAPCLTVNTLGSGTFSEHGGKLVEGNLMILQNLAIGLALGAVLATYFPMISKSAQVLGSAPLANVPFFGIAFVSSVIIALASGSRLADFGKFSQIPPFLLSAGVMSAGLIIGSSYLIPKVGLGVFVVLLVAGQILTGLIFGQIGVFGMEPQPLTFAKVAGAAMVIAGVYLVSAVD